MATETADPWAEWRQPVAQIPPIPVQEAEAESQPLEGAATVEAPQSPYAVPKTTGINDQDDQRQLGEAGDSHQIPTGPDIGTEVGATNEHYWIHTVTETIERGNADGEAYSVELTANKPYRVFGLNDLRTRATIAVASGADGYVAFGKRDRINSDSPQTGFRIASGAALDVRSRNEWWCVFLPSGDDGMTLLINVIEYRSEVAEEVLGSQANG